MSRWIWPTTAGLALAGVAISVYLTVEHYTASTTLACPDTGVVNCLKVTTSPQSSIIGIPVALLGLLFFVALAASTIPVLWRSSSPAVRWGRLGLAGVGVLTVLYLLYVELFVVDAICLWCTAIHVLAIALFIVIALRMATDDQPA